MDKNSEEYQDYVKLQISKVVKNKQEKLGGLKWEEKFHKCHKEIYAMVVAYFCSSEVKNILVLGGRWGTDVIALRNGGFAKSNITAIDLYDPPLSDLVITGDAHDLSNFYGSKIDLVWAYHVLEHFLDPLEVIAEINKVISNRGVIALAVPPFGSRPEKYDVQQAYYCRASFLSMFDEGGYDLIDCYDKLHTNNPSHYFIFRKKEIYE